MSALRLNVTEGIVLTSNIKKNALSRRGMLRASGAALLSAGVEPTFAIGMPQEGPTTPKLAMYISTTPSDAEIRRIKQIGINHVDIPEMPPLPWTEEFFRARMDKMKAQGMSLGIVMIPWSTNNAMDPDFLKIVHGLPGRDDMIEKVKASIHVAGKVGLPVIEYDFFPYRAMEGYVYEPGRGGAIIPRFNYDRMRNLPASSEGAVTYDQVWENLTYFLKAVIPVAESSNVRMCVHPNDPPPAISHGSGQVLNSLADWKRLIEIVDSPSNGLTFDCGVTRELGEDPVAVCRYFASRDRMNHMHFRNVRMQVPREKYTEVFPDEGEDDMYAVMREVVRNKYNRLILPEHPLDIDVDRELPKEYSRYTGWAYNIAYARAMLQAALEDQTRNQ